MKLGFIGLGAMGRGMASNLQAAGHELVVNDVREAAAQEFLDRGATWAATAHAVAEQVTVVFTSLPTPADVEAVGLGEDGLAAGLAAGATWIDLSTNSVDVVRRLQATMREQGVDFLDAPVSGGPGGAASGKLAIWIGGERGAYDRCESLFRDMSDEVRYIGDSGAGTVAKLCHNMASLAMNEVLVEVMTLGVKAGVEPLSLWEAIRSGAAGRQRSFDRLSQRFMQGRLDPPSFQLRLAYKDAYLATQVARELGVPMRLCELTAIEMAEALNRGWGDRDSQSVFLLQQERAGVPPFAMAADDVRRVLAEETGVLAKDS